MKIATLQMVATPDVERNLAAADRLMARASDAGATCWSRCPSTSV